MRHLAIDFGEKHIGTAISNEDGTMAFPHETLSGGPGLATAIEKIVHEKRIEVIVIGESKDYSGKENPIMEKARAFAAVLAERTGLPIYFEPEFMTSTEARHIQGGGDKTHSSAAALILKSYLDKEIHKQQNI